MEAKHTPGPWRVTKMRAMTGSTEEVLTVEGGAEIDAPEQVARIGFGVTETAKADARLIAAAPMMLEALQMAFDRDLTYLSDHAEIPRQDVVRARLAIRAALGHDA
jgi:hypothetical protein